MPIRISTPSTRGRPGPSPEARASALIPAFLAACAASLLALSGCNDDAASAPDGTSPNHMIQAPKSQGKYRFGVTDTIAVKFSESIDTASLVLRIDDSLRIEDFPGVGHAFRGRDRLLIFGTEESYGSKHFKFNTSFTLSMIGLQDDAGNGNPVINEVFQPYRWVDRDAIDHSFRGYDTLFSGDSAWIDGRPLTDTLIAEGALDFNEFDGDEDRVDIKIVRLSPPDTLEVLITSREDLPVNLQIGGPFKAEDLDSAVKKAENFIRPGLNSDRNGQVDTTFRADFETHLRVLGSSAAPGLYALRLSLPTADTEGFYRIRLRLKKFKF